MNATATEHSIKQTPPPSNHTCFPSRGRVRPSQVGLILLSPQHLILLYSISDLILLSPQHLKTSNSRSTPYGEDSTDAGRYRYTTEHFS